MLTNLTSIAVIILAFEAMLCLVIPLGITVGIAYMFFRIRRALPPKLRQVNLQAQRVNAAVNQTGARVTDSLASAEAKYVRTETLVRTLFRQTKKDQS